MRRQALRLGGASAYLACRCVQNREVQLFVGAAHLCKEVEDLRLHLVASLPGGALPVYLRPSSALVCRVFAAIHGFLSTSEQAMPSRGGHATCLVEDHNGPESMLESLLYHKFGLRQRTLVGIHEQQCTVHHAQNPDQQRRQHSSNYHETYLPLWNTLIAVSR